MNRIFFTLHDNRVLEYVTRYIESGYYDDFFKKTGNELIEQSVNHFVLPYKIYTQEDFANSTLKSNEFIKHFCNSLVLNNFTSQYSFRNDFWNQSQIPQHAARKRKQRSEYPGKIKDSF